MTDLTYAERCELAGARGLTLDGRPAAIVGTRLEFAQVVALDGSCARLEWSWESARAIVAAGGRFSS